jgi:hypothetical protein
MISINAREADIAKIAESAEATAALEKHLEDVVEGVAFKGSHRSALFLKHVIHQSIAGNFESLKERVIGMELFGRSPSYVTGEDAIVRVTANDVRKRLQQHYGKYGSASEFRINLPLGSYIPEIIYRQQSELGPHNADEEHVGPAARSEEYDAQRDSEFVSLASQKPVVEVAPAPKFEAAPSGDRPPGLAVGRAGPGWVTFALVVLAVIAGSVAATRYVLRSERSLAVATPSGSVRDFWGQFFDKPNEELKIVYADPSFALWQDLRGMNLDLGDYLNRQYLNVNGDKLFNVAMRRVTSPADMALSTHLAALAGRFGGQVDPEFARDASTDFLRHGNLVLIGSRRSNPWVQVYEPGLNFVLGQDPQTGAPLFQNRSPRPGEASEYGIPAMFDTQKVEERTFVSYAVVALLRGCGGRGMTVIAEGLNTQATQAAGDLTTDPPRLDLLLQSIGHKPGTNVAPFEALIQVTSLPGEYDNPKVIAFRLRPEQSCEGS